MQTVTEETWEEAEPDVETTEDIVTSEYMFIRTPEEYLNTALTHVDSKAIRAWTQTARNRTIFLLMAEKAMSKGTEPLRFATYIILVAEGPGAL
jgi:hypothetical protein